MSDNGSAQPAPVAQPGQPAAFAQPGQPAAFVQPGQPAPAWQPGTPAPAPAKPGNGLATAGFVLGLLGFLGAFIPVVNIVGIVLGVVGAILAAIGLAKSTKSGAGKGLALAGLILGGLALIIGIVINVVFANAVDDAIDDITDTNVQAPQNGGDADADAGELGTTRDNPAPIGSAITGGDWTVVVNSVTTADKDSWDQAPAAGSTLLVVNLTVTYNGDDSQGDSPWVTVEFVSAEGNTFDSTSGSTLFIPENQFDSLTTIYSGASVTGDEMIEVPADWTGGVLAISPDLFSDATFVAAQ